MRPSRRFLLLGVVFVLALAAALIATFPARLAYRLAAPGPQTLACAGLHGTVWAGRARSCRVLGRLEGRLRWSVATSPAGLGRLVRLAPSVRLAWRARRVALTATVVFSTPLRVRKLRGRLPLAALRAFVPTIALFGTPHGEIVFRNLDLDLGPGRLGPIVGHARLLDARFGETPGVPLGSLVFNAEEIGGHDTIEIRSLHPRTLTLDARLLLHENGGYRLTATLAALPGAPAALTAFLSTLPVGPKPGTHLFQSSGVLPLTSVGVP